MVVILQVAKRLAPQLMNRHRNIHVQKEKKIMTPTIELIVAIAPFAISLMNPFPKRSVSDY